MPRELQIVLIFALAFAAAPSLALQPGDLVINEVLYDGSNASDANGDGSVDAVEDEFIELLNVSGVPLDLTGATLEETTFGSGAPRHVFGAISLGVDEAIVIFGGGTPAGTFGGSTVLVCSACTGPAGFFGLNLDDGADAVTLKASDSTVIDAMSWSLGDAPDESLTRSPDGTGPFVPHTLASGSGGAVFSPGTAVDGTEHTGGGGGPSGPTPGDIVINEVLYDGAAGDANGDGVFNAADDEFVELLNVTASEIDLTGVELFEADNGAVAPRHVFGATLIGAGERIVLFGGGTPTGPFGGSTVIVCNACTGGASLDLDDAGDSLTLQTADDVVIDTASWSQGDAIGASWARGPEGSGPFVIHHDAPGSMGTIYSPGVALAEGTPAPPGVLLPGDIVINEVLYDGATDGDANGDGTSDAVEDEFVELLNVSGTTLDLTGAKLSEITFGAIAPRHVFGPTTLGPGEAIIVFGGGTPTGGFGGAQVVVCSACFGAGALYGLALDDGEETLSLHAGDDTLIDQTSWGPGALTDESITRSPEGQGPFVAHSSVYGSGGAVFSPGTTANGLAFPIPLLLPSLGMKGLIALSAIFMLVGIWLARDGAYLETET